MIAGTTFVTDEDLRRLDPCAKFARPADEVVMDMGLEDVCDRNLLRTGEVEVAVDIRSGIEYRGHASGIIANQIGQFANSNC